MTFLILAASKINMMAKRSDLQYQQVIISSRLDYVTSKLQYLQDLDAESDQVYCLKKYSDQLETKQANIESQLQLINASIDAYDKGISAGIKADCAIKCFGG